MDDDERGPAETPGAAAAAAGPEPGADAADRDDGAAGAAAESWGPHRVPGFTAEAGRAICARVRSGETLAAICAEAGMPSRATLWRWTKSMPRFAAELAQAKAAAGRFACGGRPSTYCEETATEFFHRLCEGESVLDICRDPAMPSFSTFYLWKKRFRAFDALMEQAREVAAERLCAEGMARARAVTPESARADRVMLQHLRWTCGVTWPRRYRQKPTEAERQPEVQRYLFQHYRLQVREDGAQRVVAPVPDPETGLPVWSTRGPWALPRSPDEAAAYAARAAQAATRADGHRVLAMDDPAAEVTHPDPEPPREPDVGEDWA
jgi:hypothetical protein